MLGKGDALLELGGHSHWIWRAQVNPFHDQVRPGAPSPCGGCAHRAGGRVGGGACWWQGVLVAGAGYDWRAGWGPAPPALAHANAAVFVSARWTCNRCRAALTSSISMALNKG